MSVSVTLFVLHWDVSPRVVPLHYCVTSVGFESLLQVSHIYGRVRLGGHPLVILCTCDSCMSL